MVQNKLLMEAYNAVLSINEKIVESISSSTEVHGPLTLQTDGNSLFIEFLGAHIWNDDEDGRDFDEEKDEYEPLKPFLIRKINEELELVKLIQL